MVYKESEQRKFVRFAYPFFALYQKVEKRDSERTAISPAKWERSLESVIKRGGSTIIKNISEGGICFVTREKFESGILLRVELYIPPEIDQLKRWSRLSGQRRGNQG